MNPKPNPNETLPLLTFRLGTQYYALRVDHVVEVAAMVETNPSPNSHPASLGIVNRHGDPLHLIDLNHVFAASQTQITTSTLFIVANSTNRAAGLVVDEVFQVQYIDINAVRPAHGAGNTIPQVASDGERLYHIIDLEAVLAMVLD